MIATGMNRHEGAQYGRESPWLTARTASIRGRTLRVTFAGRVEVMRRERERGLPVHPPGSKRAGVFAYEDELHAWLGRQAERQADPALSPAAAGASPSRRHSAILRAAGAVAAVAALALVPIVSNANGRVVERVTLDGRELRARDAEGRTPHDDRDCPLRRSVTIQQWAPTSGWRTSIVAAGGRQ